MAFRPMTFRPNTKEIAEHIEKRSKTYGSRNKYILALIKQYMGCQQAIEEALAAPPDKFDLLMERILQELKTRGYTINAEAPVKEAKAEMPPAIPSAMLQSLIKTIEASGN